MRPTYLLFAFIFCFSCGETTTTKEAVTVVEPPLPSSKMILNAEFQKILDDALVNGGILIYDPQEDTYISNDFKRSGTGFLPASTFKIPNSIIGLETGVVEDENTLFKWDGKKRMLKSWEADLTLRQAYQKSCVPCYQDIARKVGTERMNEFLKKFEYGNMAIEKSMLDLFWLEGDFRVSQMDQIKFLKKIFNSELPISAKTQKTIRNIMMIDKNKEFKLSGKTGWALREGWNLGWFVGFIETEGKVYYMATNVEPTKDFDMKDFTKIRLQVTKKALRLLKIID